MENFADLHLHTYFSDGTESPSVVVDKAAAMGFGIISITDHDTLDGVEEASERGKKRGVEVIPGVEISADYDGREVHILAYYVDPRDSAFVKQLKNVCRVRRERLRGMLSLLEDRGMSLTVEDVKVGTKTDCLGRLHLARALMRKGYVKSLGEAFRKYIGDNGPCYLSSFNLTPQDAVRIIKEAGGVPVLAHPYILGYMKDIDNLVSEGIEGIEVFHSDHTEQMQKRFLSYAKKRGLLITGGSDYHGIAKPRTKLGRVRLPEEYIQELRERVREK